MMQASSHPALNMIPEPARFPHTVQSEQAVSATVAERVRSRGSWLKWPLQAAVAVCNLFTLLLFLATLAAIPVFNVLVLGFFLELQGRYIRTGTFAGSRNLNQLGSRLGALLLGTLLCLAPIHFLTDLAYQAALINPSGSQTLVLQYVARFVAALLALHLLLVWMRGGNWSYFVRPVQNFRWMRCHIRQKNLLKTCTEIWLQFWKQPATASGASEENLVDSPVKPQPVISSLPLPVHLFWLGLRGLLLTIIWLFIPVTFFAAANSSPDLTLLLRFFGALLMLPVLCWLPFLQAQFAADNRFRSGFQWKKIRQLINRAPFLSVVSLLLLYGLSIPLFLMKVIVIPQDTVWMMSLFFVLLMLPARLCLASTLVRASRKTGPRHFLWRTSWKLIGISLVAGYLFVLFFTPYIGAHGTDILFEQPALTLPAPF